VDTADKQALSKTRTAEVKVESRDNFRILSNGKGSWFVQEHGPFGWQDDIWGGYKTSYEAASNRINELIEWNNLGVLNTGTNWSWPP
jgi:hypothetical protein